MEFVGLYQLVDGQKYNNHKFLALSRARLFLNNLCFIFELQGLQENRNKLSRSIPSLKNDKQKINNVIEEVNKIKKKIKSKEELLQETSDHLQSILLNLPKLFSYTLINLFIFFNSFGL